MLHEKETPWPRTALPDALPKDFCHFCHRLVWAFGQKQAGCTLLPSLAAGVLALVLLPACLPPWPPTPLLFDCG